MDSLFGIKLPIQDPVSVFLLILIFFLFAPLFARRLKMPGIIGLILSGIFLGPFGLNLISQDIGITMFGTVGLLYLMFLTGLEINLVELTRYRKHGFVFGALTFFIPLSLGLLITYYILKMPFKTALLFSSIFSTHTLISYPIISRYGLTQIKIAGITIGGTIITDTAVLLLLTIVAASTHGEIGWMFSFKLVSFFLILIGFSVLLLPKIGRWLLARLQGENGYQFIAVLMMVFFTGFLAKILGIEPIIGAFFAGLALNKLIPQKSPLMNRIVFIGNNLFIPFFLLSVGMLIDLKALLAGHAVLLVAFIIISAAILSKFLATYVMQLLFRYSSTERNLMFGLSTSHAAATIAVVLVGYQLNLFDSDLMNVAILIILFSCMLGSIVTEKAARKLSQIYKQDDKHEEFKQAERILVPLANPSTLEYLMSFAFTIKKTGSREPIYPLTVLHDDATASQKILQFNRNLEKYHIEASSTEESISPMVRIEVSAVDGIIRAVKEKMITKIVIGWNVKVSASNLILGSLLEKLIEKANKMLIIINIDKPLETFKSIKIFIPPDVQNEPGFDDCISTFLTFSGRLKKETIFFCETPVQNYLETQLTKQVFDAQGYRIIEYTEWSNFNNYAKSLALDELLIFINLRPKSFSYLSYLDNIPRILSRFYNDHCFVLVYPEDQLQPDDSLSSRLGTV
jgi:Kef-type K+ transport system membrane component KefB